MTGLSELPVLILLLILVLAEANRLAEIRTVSEYLNICPDGKLHKRAPGKEKNLYRECSRYEDRACCRGNTTGAMFTSSRWHGLSYDHCPARVMGNRCREMFMKELCFYECSPNVGPWLVQVDQKIRRERPYGVPLCKQQCDRWWDACKMEFTCITNWGRGFNWYMGHNQCPAGSVCERYEKKFGTAENFCQTVWDGGWKVVNDSQSCFVFDFDPSGGNPNHGVALARASVILSSGSSRLVSLQVFFKIFFFCLFLFTSFQ